MRMKNIFCLLVLFVVFVFGHKINIFGTVKGNRVYTQSYASDGGKIKGGMIEVYDKAGNKLLTGKTDSLGEYSFTIPKKDDLKIVVIGGMGHRAETIISVDELPEIKPAVVKKETKPTTEKEVVPNKEVMSIDTLLLRQTIEDVLRSQLHPVLKMIAEQKKETISFTEIIGGIGYIIGIIGIAMFFMSKRKNV